MGASVLVVIVVVRGGGIFPGEGGSWTTLNVRLDVSTIKRR